MSTFMVTLLGKYLCYALLAIALDLVWGYVGILSLGHGAFFALGGYAMGMYLMRQIGARGVYGNPELPDFMVFLNWDALPWYWHGFDQFWFAMLMVVLVPGLLAFVFGWLAFRSRVTGVYLSIITQALTYALMLAFFRNEMGFGGNNGLTDFKDILGYNLQSDATRIVLFLCSILALARVTWSAATSSRRSSAASSPRFATPRAACDSRASAPRLQALGIHAVRSPRRHRRGAVRPSGRHHQSRTSSSRLNSIELVVWVAIGGRGHAVRRSARRRDRQLREVDADGRAARGVAVRAGRAVRARHDRAAERLRRPREPLQARPTCLRRAPRASDDRHGALGGIVARAQLDPVPRQDLRELRRLPRAEQPESLHRARRAALHDRPERRGQDHHDGRHHG